MLDFDHTYIGCGNKLSAHDLVSLGFIQSYKDLLNDSSELGDNLVVTVDTVMPTSSTISHFAKCAYLHCANDLYSVGSTPMACTISFGLSQSLNGNEKKELVISTQEVLKAEGVKCLNYHSYVADQTSITYTLIGEKNKALAPLLGRISKGMNILITKPLVLYPNTKTHNSELIKTYLTSNKNIIKVQELDSIITKDISGFGLIGSLLPYFIDTPFYASINKGLIPFVGVADNSSHCTFKKNIESFSNNIDLPLNIEENYIHASLSGQSNGPILIFTLDSSKTLELLKSFGFEATKIGVVSQALTNNKKEVCFI